MAPQYLTAMKIDLSKYMTERYQDSMLKQEYEGPVITIARDFGCPGRKIAARLTNQLNQLKNSKSKSIRWRWISKEIMAESARELEMDPADIKYVFQYEKKTVFDDILSSQSRKYYKSDRKIRKTVAQVIRNIASEGNVVIIGRGGVAITKDIERSLHVKLEAPMEWRTLRASEKYCISLEEAKKRAVEIDKKRQEFRNYFHGTGSDYTRFDVRYNCMSLSLDDIACSIVSLLKSRRFV
jgi:cytidylate kinase